eukprot:1581233-Amphidinium_carterae.1
MRDPPQPDWITIKRYRLEHSYTSRCNCLVICGTSGVARMVEVLDLDIAELLRCLSCGSCLHVLLPFRVLRPILQGKVPREPARQHSHVSVNCLRTLYFGFTGCGLRNTVEGRLGGESVLRQAPTQALRTCCHAIVAMATLSKRLAASEHEEIACWQGKEGWVCKEMGIVLHLLRHDLPQRTLTTPKIHKNWPSNIKSIDFSPSPIGRSMTLRTNQRIEHSACMGGLSLDIQHEFKWQTIIFLDARQMLKRCMDCSEGTCNNTARYDPKHPSYATLAAEVFTMHCIIRTEARTSLSWAP